MRLPDGMCISRGSHTMVVCRMAANEAVDTGSNPVRFIWESSSICQSAGHRVRSMQV